MASNLRKRRRDGEDDEDYEDTAAAAAGPAGEASDMPERKKSRAAAKKTDVRARAQKPRGDLTDASANRNLTTHSGDKREHKTTLEIYAERETEDLARVKKALDLVKIKKARKATPLAQAAEGQLIDALFTGPAIHSRTFRAKLSSQEMNRNDPCTWWVFGAEDSNGTYRFISGQVQSEELDQTTAQKVATDLANMLNRWPGALDTISSPNLPNQLQAKKAATWARRAAIQRHCPNIRPMLRNPSLDVSVSPPAMHVNFALIDPSTGQDYGFRELIRSHLVSDSDPPHFQGLRFSKVEKNAVLNRSFAMHDDDFLAVTQDQDGNDVYASSLPQHLGGNEKHRSNLVKAENVGRALLAKLDNRIMDKKTAKKTIQFFLEEWGKTKARESRAGPYDGKALIKVVWRPSQRTITIMPSDAVVADISGKIPAITIRSLDRTRALPVINVITSTYVETGDLKQAFLAGHRSCLQVNEEIAQCIPSSNFHQCSDSNMCRSITRNCGRCGRAVQCFSLQPSIFKLDLCTNCKAWERTLEVGLPEAVSLSKHATQFRAECKRADLKLNDPKVNKIFEAAQQEVKQHFPDIGPGWHDDFRSKQFDISPEKPGATGSLDPYGPSVDSLFPYYPASDTRDYKHSANNIGIIATALNYCKQTQVPALFEVIKYMLTEAEKTSNASAAQLKEVQLAVVKTCTVLKRIRLKSNFQAVLRAKLLKHTKLSSRRYELDAEEWRFGKLRKLSGAWDIPRYAKDSKVATFRHRRWRDETLDRVKALVKMLESEFHVSLVRSEDDCPWIGLQETMPNGWGWPLCFALMADRHDRMENRCNGLDITVDTPDTIFIEVIFVICVTACTVISDGKYWTAAEKKAFKVEYAEFLSLPMTADIFNPLCFAVAHKYHGMMMATGWKHEPKTPADRSNDHNNILIETRTSNFLKSNFIHSTYDDIKQMIRDINLPKKYYDPEGKLSKELPEEAYDFSMVTEEEGFDLEETVTNDMTAGPFEPEEGDPDIEILVEETDVCSGLFQQLSVDRKEVAALATELENAEWMLEEHYPDSFQDSTVADFFENMNAAKDRGDGDGFRAVQAALYEHLGL